MTLDLTIAPADLSSTCRRQVATLTGPNPYATGGDALTPNDVRMGKLFAILGGVMTNGTAALLVWYNVSTAKLMWFDMAGAEVANGTDLSGYTGRVEFIGQ